MTDELKPCPFCGGHARMNIVMDSVGVSCRLCGASLIDETREDAIAAWNARAPSVPEGWQLVPVVPTDAMATAGWQRAQDTAVPVKDGLGTVTDSGCCHIYAAMLAASRKVP